MAEPLLDMSIVAAAASIQHPGTTHITLEDAVHTYSLPAMAMDCFTVLPLVNKGVDKGSKI